MGISACRSNCLSQGSACIASTSLSDGTGQCYSKPPGFISGYRNPALPSTSYVKVCGPAQPSPPPGVLTVENSRSRGLRVWVVCVAVVITLLGLIAVESGLWWWCCRNSPKFDSLSAQYALLEYASGAPVQFSRLIDQGVDIEQVTRAIQVSFWCIQEHPSQRPMMGKHQLQLPHLPQLWEFRLWLQVENIERASSSLLYSDPN
ncbi:hypothetical protein OIU77_004691 [Salix suchowensis]|uniref:Apple domain-containing protein n=1 Tax=Salix suchowensis TaxID=1278906 RepID=A0ABQ9AX97_9ROSI|nr:hypothetical protein OIU77_004691 [Salix suchowensis]